MQNKNKIMVIAWRWNEAYFKNFINTPDFREKNRFEIDGTGGGKIIGYGRNESEDEIIQHIKKDISDYSGTNQMMVFLHSGEMGITFTEIHNSGLQSFIDKSFPEGVYCFMFSANDRVGLYGTMIAGKAFSETFAKKIPVNKLVFDTKVFNDVWEWYLKEPLRNLCILFIQKAFNIKAILEWQSKDSKQDYYIKKFGDRNFADFLNDMKKRDEYVRNLEMIDQPEAIEKINKLDIESFREVNPENLDKAYTKETLNKFISWVDELGTWASLKLEE